MDNDFAVLLGTKTGAEQESASSRTEVPTRLPMCRRRLLEANVRMHPPSKQDAERPHILMLNRNAAGKDNLWLPHEECVFV